MLTKGLPVIAIKIGFCQPKRLFWEISVAEVNLPGEKSFCVHTIAGVLIYFGVCVILCSSIRILLGLIWDILDAARSPGGMSSGELWSKLSKRTITFQPP